MASATQGDFVVTYYPPPSILSSLGINALRACVYIFTSGSSALLGSLHCDLSILPYSIHFYEFMPIYFTRKKGTKHENARSPSFSYVTMAAEGSGRAKH